MIYLIFTFTLKVNRIFKNFLYFYFKYKNIQIQTKFTKDELLNTPGILLF
jgi:hypothetical protein